MYSGTNIILTTNNETMIELLSSELVQLRNITMTFNMTICLRKFPKQSMKDLSFVVIFILPMIMFY